MLAHETQYRGQAAPARLSAVRVVIFGCGALGSETAVSLARIGCGSFVLVDRDRVDDSNLGTQAYLRAHIGQQKPAALCALLRQCSAAEAEMVSRTVSSPSLVYRQRLGAVRPAHGWRGQDRWVGSKMNIRFPTTARSASSSPIRTS